MGAPLCGQRASQGVGPGVLSAHADCVGAQEEYLKLAPNPGSEPVTDPRCGGGQKALMLKQTPALAGCAGRGPGP